MMMIVSIDIIIIMNRIMDGFTIAQWSIYTLSVCGLIRSMMIIAMILQTMTSFVCFTTKTIVDFFVTILGEKFFFQSYFQTNV